jgi:hypothetical protein
MVVEVWFWGGALVGIGAAVTLALVTVRGLH